MSIKVMRCKELRSMELKDLVATVQTMRKDLMELRMRSVTTHNASYASDGNALKKSIARALTIIKETS